MKLILEGHEYKYAAEQIMMSVLPDARPEYGEVGEGDDWARVKLTRGEKFTTCTVRLRYKGLESSGAAKTANSALTGKLAADRQCQMIVKLAFYRAAVKVLPEKPVWGALTGIRPGTLLTKMLEEGMTEEQAVKRMESLYYVDRDRALLCADTARASLEVKKSLGERDIALYIGIPFCPTRCAYCSFVSQSIEKNMSLIEPFFEVLLKELRLLGEKIGELKLNVIAVYIGGGTPTTLYSEQITGLCRCLRECFDLKNMREFSIEAGRPDTITEEKLAAIEAGGATRISINPQSMNDEVLAAIGRRHSSEDIRTAYRQARELTRADINMDLIAGLPGDTEERFKATVDELIAMEPENITIHTLALKRGTQLKLEGAPLPGKPEVAAMLDYSQRALRAAGYKPYYLYRQKFMSGGFENIGWAKEHKENLYNILIMEELTSIIAAGGGGSTKLVERKTGKVEHIYDFKYPKEYIGGFDKTAKDKEKLTRFYEENFK